MWAMSSDSVPPVPDVADLLSRIDLSALQGALEEAYRRGFSSGVSAERARVAAAGSAARRHNSHQGEPPGKPGGLRLGQLPADQPLHMPILRHQSLVM